MGWATFWAIFSQTHLVTLVFLQTEEILRKPNSRQKKPDEGMPILTIAYIPTYFFQKGCLGWGANPGSFIFLFIFSSLYR
jgi:hypothetical protein